MRLLFESHPCMYPVPPHFYLLGIGHEIINSFPLTPLCICNSDMVFIRIRRIRTPQVGSKTLGIKELLMAISHHFQTLTYQPLPGTMLEYVRLCWVILGCDGYNLVTVLVTDWPEPCNHPGRGRKDYATEFDVSLSLS
jgi:hypothetical protein